MSKLEDQLADAEKHLAATRAELTRLETELRPEILGIVREGVELPPNSPPWHRGLYTDAFRAAVAKWAGLEPGEEHEAKSRNVDLLRDATVRLAGQVIGEHTKGLSDAADAARSVSGSAWSKTRRVSTPVSQQELRVQRAQYAVDDIRSRILDRDTRKAAKSIPLPEGEPVQSPADKARFVEARKRLSGSPHSAAKPFTWEPVK